MPAHANCPEEFQTRDNWNHSTEVGSKPRLLLLYFRPVGRKVGVVSSLEGFGRPNSDHSLLRKSLRVRHRRRRCRQCTNLAVTRWCWSVPVELEIRPKANNCCGCCCHRWCCLEDDNSYPDLGQGLIERPKWGRLERNPMLWYPF